MVDLNQPPTAASVPAGTPQQAPADFGEFFHVSYREVVKTVMIMGATLEEAQDAASKAYLEMLPRWPVRPSPLAYARRAAASNFIKDKTRQRRKVQHLIERGYVLYEEGAEESQLTALEDEEWVTQVLSGLPDAQRMVMACIAKGLDRDEIADRLGITRAAVRQNLCKARARLARELHPGSQHSQPPRSPREDAR